MEHCRVNQLCQPGEVRYSAQQEVMRPLLEAHKGCLQQKEVYRMMAGLDYPTMERSLVEEHRLLVGVEAATCHGYQ